MVNLTAVIIAKNEEGRIRKCLDSLKGFAASIVVIDNLSTDRTVEVCKKYGAEVIVHEEKEYFGNQRNIGIRNAPGDWIIQMDADEIVPKETAEKIIKTLEAPGEFAAFRVLRKNFFLGYPLKTAGNYGYMTRILRKGRAIYASNCFHEELDIDGPVGDIEAEIEHYPFSSISQVIDKCNYYSEIESDLFLRNTDKVSIREIKYRLTWKSLKLFWKLYIRKKGYKDGMHGLAWCILNVIGPQVRWLKIWEKASKDGKLIRG